MNLPRSLKRLAWLPAVTLLALVGADSVWAQGTLAQRRAEKERLLGGDRPDIAMQRAADATDRGFARLNVSALEVRTFNFGAIGGVDGWSTLFYPRTDGNGRANFYFNNTLAIGVPEGAWQANAQVHESGGSYQSVNKGDWEALDGARGSQFSDPPQTYGGYPLMAESDLPATWPATGWPAPESATEVWLGTDTWTKWERHADREAYSEFDDSYAGRDGTGESSPLGLYVRKRALAYGSMDAVFVQHEIENTSSNTYPNVFIGQIADNGSPTTSSFLGYPHWDGTRNLIYNIGTNYDPVAGTHQSDDGYVEGWVGQVFLESPTGSMKSDLTDTMVDSPTTVLTRRALLDWGDQVLNYEEGLYGALSGDVSYMTLDPTAQDNVWKVADNGGTPKLLQDETDFQAHYPNYASSADIFFYIASGPITLAPGDKVNYVMAYVAGPTEGDMLGIADKAINTYQAQFNTSGPPPAPTAEVAGVMAGPSGVEYDPRIHRYPMFYTDSGSITISWDGQESETARDAITAVQDFEGYRIYRSSDRGATWGARITDSQGNNVGWVPYAQYDLENSIVGNSPDGFYVGNDTGLVHTFTDTDIMDGMEYWYSITAYDYAPPDPVYESAMGGDPGVPNVVAVVAGSRPNGYMDGLVGGAAASTLTPTSLGGNFAPEGSVTVAVVSGTEIPAGTYTITTTSGADYGLNTYSNSIGITLADGSGTIFSGILPESGTFGDDLLPVADGLKISVSSLFNGADPYDHLSWSSDATTTGFAPYPNPYDILYGDDWFFGATKSVYDVDEAATFPDVELRFSTTNTQWAYAYNRGGYTYRSYNQVPLTVWDVSSSPARQLNLRYTVQTTEIEDSFDFDDDPLGPNRHYFQIMFSDYSGATPDTAYTTGTMSAFNATTDVMYTGIPGTTTGLTVNDLSGETITIDHEMPIGPGVSYSFTTTAPTIDDASVNIDDVKVVPNPYYIFAPWDQSENKRKIQFTNVPANSTIDIYTLSGELVASLDHHGDATAAAGSKGYSSNQIGTVDWNIWTYEFTEAAYGLYIYVVKTDDGQTKVGKFAIIR